MQSNIQSFTGTLRVKWFLINNDPRVQQLHVRVVSFSTREFHHTRLQRGVCLCLCAFVCVLSLRPIRANSLHPTNQCPHSFRAVFAKLTHSTDHTLVANHKNMCSQTDTHTPTHTQHKHDTHCSGVPCSHCCLLMNVCSLCFM